MALVKLVLALLALVALANAQVLFQTVTDNTGQTTCATGTACNPGVGSQPAWQTTGGANPLFWGLSGTLNIRASVAPANGATFTLNFASASGVAPQFTGALTFTPPTLTWAFADCPVPLPPGQPATQCLTKQVVVTAAQNGFNTFTTTPAGSIIVPQVYSGRAIAVQYTGQCAPNAGLCGANPIGAANWAAAQTAGLPATITPSLRPLQLNHKDMQAVGAAPVFLSPNPSTPGGTTIGSALNVISGTNSVTLTIRLVPGTPVGTATPAYLVPSSPVTLTPVVYNPPDPFGATRQWTPLSGITVTPSPVVISSAAQSVTFTITGIPRVNPSINNSPVPNANYLIYFNDPNGVSCNGGLASAPCAASATANPQWEVPSVTLNIQPVSISIDNWPPVPNTMYITNSVGTPSTSYQYQMRIKRIPSDVINTGNVVVTVSNTVPTGCLTFYQNGVQNSVFTFAGTNTVLPFQLQTSSSIGTCTVSFQVSPNDGTVVISSPGIVAVAPVNNINTWSAAVSVLENQIYTAVQFIGSPAGLPTQSAGPYPGEPFYIDFKWIPATPQGFTLTIGGQRTDQLNGGAIAYSVPAGASSFRAGPFTPSIPQGVDQASDIYQLVYTVGLTGPDSFMYGVNINGVRNSVTLPITINKRYFVAELQNTPTGGAASANLQVSTTGTPSVPTCISMNLPLPTSASFGSGTVTLTPIATGSDPVPSTLNGLIFSPPTLTFSSTVQTACFTAQFDWQRVAYSDITGVMLPPTTTWTLTWQLGGALADVFVNPGSIINQPTYSLVQPSIRTWLSNGGTFWAGDSAILYVVTDFPYPTGLNYNLVGTGLTFTPLNCANTAGSALSQPQPNGCTFAAAAAGQTISNQQHLWNVSTANIVPGEGNGAAGFPNAATTYTTALSFEVTGGDGGRYVLPPALSVSVVRRTLLVNMPTTSLYVGVASPILSVTLQEPAVNGFTLRPYVATDQTGGVSSAALTFNPPTYTFVRGGPSSLTFTVTGNMLSQADGNAPSSIDFLVRWAITGLDAPIYQLQVSGPAGDSQLYVRVQRRPLPTISIPAAQNLGAFYAGAVYGPQTVSWATVGVYDGESLQPQGSESISIEFWGSDFVILQNNALVNSVTLTGAAPTASFGIQFVPDAAAARYSQTADKFTAQIFYKITGPDAWKYQQFPVTPVTTSVTYRPIAITWGSPDVSVKDTDGTTYPNGIVVGTTRYGQVATPFVSSFGGSVTITPFAPGIIFTPSVFTFNTNNGTVQPFAWQAVAYNALANAGNAGSVSGILTSPTSNANLGTTGKVVIPVTFNVSGSDARFFATPATTSVVVVRRSFIWDVNGGSAGVSTSNAISNLETYQFTTGPSNHFVVGRTSQVFTITASAPPTESVTLTIQHPLLSFQSAANCGGGPSLTFSSNQIACSFTFTPNKFTIPPIDGVLNFPIVLSGADANLYDTSALVSALNNIRVLPPLLFSPIPATYIDGTAEDLSVTLADSFASGANGFPYPADRSFSLHISAPAAVQVGSVYIEPDTLQFGPNSPVTQNFRIVHRHPNRLNALLNAGGNGNGNYNGYDLTWKLKWVGQQGFTSTAAFGDAIDISKTIVPPDAQRVVVTRHQIIPQFPRQLSFDWQRASFNITRGPVAHLSLHPHAPVSDGAITAATRQVYGGAKAAGGRVAFDPPVVIFNPGQTVAEFSVKAIPGIDRESVYYRVDWQMSGHLDDLASYVESGDTHPTDQNYYTFSTWHTASASSLALTSLVVVFVSLFLLL